MQKKFIALAVAALASGAAFAQSNVTIYGVADASFENVKAEGATAANSNIAGRSRLQTNSSYIGFKGSEDLGNGLKALFQFETQVSLDSETAAAGQNVAPGVGNLTPTASGTASNSTFTKGRDSFVALSGNFGTVLGGYVSTPHRNVMASYDVMPGAAGVAGANGVFGKVDGGINSFFRTQAVAYASPAFNGFSGVIAYVPNEGKSVSGQTGTVNPNGWNLGLNYANGGLKLAYSYLKLNDVGAQGARIGTFNTAGASLLTDESHKFHLLAANYNFGQGTTVSGMYQRFTGDVVANATSAADAKLSSYWLGVKHVIGANELAASYQHAGNIKAGGALTGLTEDTKASQWSLRYGYNFSKRTQAYAVYSKITNKANAGYNFGGDAGVTSAATGSDPQAFGVGIRHSF